MALIVCFLALDPAWEGKISAQKLNLGASKFEKFRVPPAFYPGSNQKRLLLTGEQARPQGANQLWIKQLRIETYYRSGTTNLVIQAPECLYQTVHQTVSSDGPLNVRSGEGRFTLAGQKGFIYYQTNNNLVVSNQVRVQISKQQAASTPIPSDIQAQGPTLSAQVSPDSEQPLIIDCDQGADWDFNTGLAVFRGNVRVADNPGFTLRCELLTVHFNPGGTTNDLTKDTLSAPVSADQPAGPLQANLETNLRLQKIIAEQDVDIHFSIGQSGMGQAQCGHVTYHATNDLVTLHQVKRIDLPQGTITASTVTWDRKNNKWLSPPSSGFQFDAKPSLLALGGANSPSEQTLTIQCDNGAEWDSQGGLAVFNGNVRVTDEPDFKLRSEELTVYFNPGAGTDGVPQETPSTGQPAGILEGNLGMNARLEKIVADKNVDIHFASKSLTGQALCGNLIYTATNDLVTLNQVKRVDLPQGTITASSLTWDRQNNKWSSPPSSAFRFDAKPNLLASKDTNHPTEHPLTIQCDNGAEWNSQAGRAAFNGNVRVTDEPGFKLRSEVLTVYFNPDGATNAVPQAAPASGTSTHPPAGILEGNLGMNVRLEKIVAEEQVDIHFASKSLTGQAACGELVYTATNDLVTLNQVKWIKIPQGTITASTVYWNRRNHKFSYTGNYRFDASGELTRFYNLRGTNQPNSPRFSR